MELEARDQATTSKSEAHTSVLGAPSALAAVNELLNVNPSDPDLKDIVSDFISEDKLKLLGK